MAVKAVSGGDFDPAQPLTYLWVAGRVLSGPRRFFREMPADPDLGRPFVFLLITHLIPAMVVFFWRGLAGSWDAAALAGTVASSLGQGLLATLVLFLSARFAVRSSLELSAVFRIYAYSGAIWALSFLFPLAPAPGPAVLTALAGLVHLYLVLAGLMAAGRMSLPLAAACLIITLVVVGVVAGLSPGF